MQTKLTDWVMSNWATANEIISFEELTEAQLDKLIELAKQARCEITIKSKINHRTDVKNNKINNLVLVKER